MAIDNGETIFALASGGLPSGIAVVRLSGPAVRAALETIIDSVPEPRRAKLVSFRGLHGEVIDRGLVLFFPGPGSFTGEDVAEFHLHGGRAVVAAMLALLGGMGFRPAGPGEFTRRAFANGRLDLTEVEGLADLVAAETEAQRRQAIRQAGGLFRARLEGWRERLLRARAMVEAELDFADEDDVPPAVSDRAWIDAAAVAEEIGAVLDDRHRGERLRDGAEIVLVGPVNAGKSSLLNALARRDVAIVSPEPGTTRDLIEARLDLGGYPVTIVDTAGLRLTAGAVEREGIRRAELRAGAADVVLRIEDVTSPRDAVAASVGSVVLRVGTKIDLVDSVEERTRLSVRYDVLLSSETGEGLDLLVNMLLRFARESMDQGEVALVTRARHRAALLTAREALARAVNNAVPLELRAEDLRRAADAIGRVTGRIDVEDLLDVIFRDFCIGK